MTPDPVAGGALIESLGVMFALGLLGSLHCIGMCGGLVGALALSRPAIWWPGLWVYQAGRVTAYALFGLLAGVFGTTLAGLGGHPLQQLLAIIAGLVMIVFALNLAGWLPDPLQRLTARVSQLLGLGRLARLLAGRPRLSGWYGMGFMNGLLPCGLVYAALALALAAGGMVDAGVMMAAFGLGTVPAMLLAPSLLRALSPQLRGHVMRVAAVLLIALGVATMLRSGAGMHGMHAPALAHALPGQAH